MTAYNVRKADIDSSLSHVTLHPKHLLPLTTMWLLLNHHDDNLYLPNCPPTYLTTKHRQIDQERINMRWSTIFTATCSLLALGASSSPIDVRDIKVLLTTATGGSEKTFK
jgi:hypothetical protein